jgi:hypothetical protein
MRKYIAVALATCAVIVAPALASPEGGDLNQPAFACADITNAGGVYGSDGTISFIAVRLAAPSCKYVTYTLHVLDANGTEIATTSANGDGSIVGPPAAQLIPSVTVDPANTTICVYFTSSVGGGAHVIDRAPDGPPTEIECKGASIGSAFAYGGFS